MLLNYTGTLLWGYVKGLSVDTVINIVCLYLKTI